MSLGNGEWCETYMRLGVSLAVMYLDTRVWGVSRWLLLCLVGEVVPRGRLCLGS